ncbi:GIY-YIG nuclease family protein [Jannaschia marina]|uniref:GIY-YIG nuclease family protein n=1 Tax=Jannaschia marina TaxID=2741674 RepID=UPI0015C82141|nr:GIY-YIG nuclease family protein [Jannaschia marina]
MFELTDVLERAGIAPGNVNVMLHSPRDGDLQAMLPGLVRTRRVAMETYQATHGTNATRALSRGRPYVASFVKTGLGQVQGRSAMLFAGLYANPGPRQATRAEIAGNDEVRWLYETFGSYAELDDMEWTHWPWFDLRLTDFMAEMQGRLVIDVRLTPNYVRLAEKLRAPVTAIHAESAFDAAPPDWREMRPTAGMLGALPESWARRLAEWRGVYLIVDTADGKRYVGSAAGEENLLGRWRQHVTGEIGVTVGLRDRDPRRFRFSILERMSPDATPGEVSRREQTWMDRLETVRFGLNRPRPEAVP